MYFLWVNSSFCYFFFNILREENLYLLQKTALPPLFKSAKFEKKKTENSDKSPTLKMAEKAKKLVNKDIEKIEKRRGRKD